MQRFLRNFRRHEAIKGSLRTWQGITELSTGLTCQNDNQNQSSEIQLSPSQITNLGGRGEWYGMGEVHENEAPRELVKINLLKHKSIREIAFSLGGRSRHSWHDNSKS